MPRNRVATASPPSRRPLRDENRLLEELVAVLTLAASAFVFLSFYSYQSGVSGLNLGGRVGFGLASAVVQALGFAAYVIPLGLALVALLLFFRASEELSPARLIGAIVLMLSAAVIVSLIAPDRSVALSGGWVGGFAASLLREAFGVLGAFVVASASLLVSFIFVTRISLGNTAALAARAVQRGTDVAVTSIRSRAAAPAGSRHPPSNVRKEIAPAEAAPVIVLADAPAGTPRAAASKTRARRSVQEEFQFDGSTRYSLPSLTLLDTAAHPSQRIDEEALRKSSQILETKLGNFGIEGKVVEVRPGPVITTFDIEPAPGVKVNRIVGLGDDLAMALRAPGVRILAPVPGKAVVGIEVANPRRDEVRLRELLESEAFVRSPSPMTLALGKNTSGLPVIGDLGRMPHLLVAGATGSGKSVALNAMIVSILYKASPRDLRFVMIDLKMLELSVYEDIPHLLVPVVTDPKKAVVVLKNIVEQMDERYRQMKQHGVRNLDGYNRIIDETNGGAQDGVVELTQLADDESDDDDAAAAALRRERFPRIVVIIDELADLMMTMGRQVEEPITRLAQKARAAGIHLILATQRPSVDVITGLIKANFPARMSFQTTSRVDSRTILDHIGAERLLGGGDMLYMPPGTAQLLRLHGPLVTEDEIRKIVTFIKRQGMPQYAFDLLQNPEGDDDGDVEDDLSDELYDQAVRLVTESRQASISWVQRRLRVGYNRAARMIERMEREGVVSASDGGRPRDVLAPRIDAE